jgi:sulfite exporter TauE/SafE
MDVNVATPVAAFLAGLATSLHCAVMCGPLACALGAKPARYHRSRMVAYSVVGGLCGGLGEGLAALFQAPPLRLTPWALAIVLIGIAFRLDKRLPQPRWLTAILLRARLRDHLGLLTPLLPCGPLWMMFGVAAVGASAVRGALLLAAFVLGTIPLYTLLQGSFRRLPALWIYRAQRALALIAAGLLVWRATLPAHGSCH